MSSSTPTTAAAPGALSSETTPRQPNNTITTPSATTNLANVSFQDMLKQHRSKMAALKEDSEHTYRMAMGDASTASAHLIRDVNMDLKDIHTNEQQIETQIKELAAQTEQFRRKMNSWGQMFIKFNQAVKELGDVENWSKCINEDVNECLTILDDVSAKKRSVLGLDNK